MHNHAKHQKELILAIDDEINELKLVKRTLNKHYDVVIMQDPEEAAQFIKLHGDKISAILSDQIMPKLKGTQLLKIARHFAPNAVKILVTAYVDEATILTCINECEAYCYLLKPYDPLELRHILKQGLMHRSKALEHKNILGNVKQLLFGTVQAICEALDAKDQYTNGHSCRVTLYAEMIAKQLDLNDERVEKLKLAGLLHDIGKIGTPESILNKPGRLTDEEFDIIQQHPKRGADIVRSLSHLGDAVDWIMYHHERYDGRGYPHKLAGDDIPLEAAILAVADTYDAMTSDRSYRKGLPHAVALEEIQKCSGSQFNPVVAEAFVQIEKEMEATLILSKSSDSAVTTSILLGTATPEEKETLLTEKLCS